MDSRDSGIFNWWTAPEQSMPAKTLDEQVQFESLSFASSQPAEWAVWHLNLPADPQSAAEELAEREAQAAAADAALQALPARLSELVEGVRSFGRASFDLAGAAGVSPAEAELLQSLASFSQVPGATSFGLEGALSAEWRADLAGFQQASSRLLRILAYPAWVETRSAGRLLGLTVVGWTGDMGTACGKSLGGGDLQLHGRSLRLALASRAALLRTLTATAATAARLAVLIPLPGGAALALPAVWKYIRRLLSELDAYRQLAA